MIGHDYNDPLRGLELRCRALLAEHPNAGFVSHLTAVRLWGAPLGAAHLGRGIVDFAVALPQRGASAIGIRSHRLTIDPVDIVEHRGLPITAPARTWVDVGSMLPIGELIAIGRWLIHGDAPLATLAELAAKASAHPPHKSRTRLLDAVAQLAASTP